jgi:hypothetical protein
MPLIRIRYDAPKVTESEILQLSKAVQKIVSEVTGIEDVFVYADSSKISVKIAPIEVFVEMSAHKIPDAEALIKLFRDRLSAWKKESGYAHPINLSLIPMPWKVEIGI